MDYIMYIQCCRYTIATDYIMYIQTLIKETLQNCHKSLTRTGRLRVVKGVPFELGAQCVWCQFRSTEASCTPLFLIWGNRKATEGG